jgi:hypothetical protein
MASHGDIKKKYTSQEVEERDESGQVVSAFFPKYQI